jgi:hypothetical protein
MVLIYSSTHPINVVKKLVELSQRSDPYLNDLSQRLSQRFTMVRFIRRNSSEGPWLVKGLGQGRRTTGERQVNDTARK